MNRTDAFDLMIEILRDTLPAELQGFRPRKAPHLLKIAYGNDRVHYEVAPDTARGALEVALHFEDGPASTVAWLGYFDGMVVEVKEQLGPDAHLERWTASWGRFYELHQMPTLDAALARRAGERLATFITVLEPLVQVAGVPPERSAMPEGTFRRRWRR